MKTLSDNGLPVTEITFHSAAGEETIRLTRQHFPDVLIAAGTVLTLAQVVVAKNAGADCIVTSGFNQNIVKLCRQLALMIMPRVNNPMVIEAALEPGINALNFSRRKPVAVNKFKSFYLPYLINKKASLTEAFV